ncbi:Major Facilitator Superfamily [Geosmithia morbida]|uniref:Major Facilitator Superfamily n=1 Tax=Geosmithia morbida TaxID=1094350 RepID=A0A9P4YMY1_9HYPO|nr:Major Facilitator Superfamily [Geosmithia morbida]KAF4119412.1 Major Facilitator Superfamily [Geosmithia morbida]
MAVFATTERAASQDFGKENPVVEKDGTLPPSSENTEAENDNGILKHWEDKEEAALIRKLDIILIPVLALAFFSLQVDRGNISAVLTSTITKDLDITTDQINVGTQLLSAGIVLSEIPANIILQRIGPRVWLSGQLFAWGLVATFQAFIQSYPAYLATRILLGLCEGGFIPGALYYLSTWYKKDETTLRVSLFFYGQMFASATTSLISAGALTLEGKSGLEGWRWIFLIEGLITLFIGFIFVFLIAPAVGDGRALITFGRWSYFTEREGQICRDRVLLDDPNKAKGHIRITWPDIKGTISQVRVWQHWFITLISMTAFQGLVQYTPTLIKSMGFTAVRANALTSVGPYIGIIWLTALSWIADRIGHRGPFVLLSITWNVISYTCLRVYSLDGTKWHKYSLVIIANVAYVSMHIFNVSWLSVHCKKPQERSVALALIIMAANCAGISGSQIFRASNAPHYLKSLTAICALMGGAWVLTAVLGLQYYMKQNKRSGSTFGAELLSDLCNIPPWPGKDNMRALSHLLGFKRPDLRYDAQEDPEKMTTTDGAPDTLADEKRQNTLTEVIDTAIDVAPEYSDVYLRRLRWKIDLILLPLMWLCYGTQQADKTSLSVMAVFGIAEDTGLVGDQLNWLSTIFYLSYMVFEFPGNWLMQKVHMGRFLSVVIVLWGVVVLCIAFARNFTELMVLRTLQGALECTISPTFMLITGAWYTSQEHTLRSVIWGTANAGMNIITGLSMYGIGLHAQKHPGGLAAWKGQAFFLGGLTILCGVLVWFVLGTPREVRWLSKEEKEAAIARVLINQTGSDREKHSSFRWDQVRDTFKDPQTYFFFFVTIINALPNGANTTFSKLIWKSFGFTPLETLLKGSTPYYAVSIVWFLTVGFITLKKPNLRLIWTFLPSNVAGRTKKTVTSTVLFVAYCVGNAIGAQIMLPSDAPRYIRGITACGVLYFVEFCAMGLWRFYYIWENKRRAKLIQEQGFTQEESQRQGKINAESDMTDRENIHFEYKY